MICFMTQNIPELTWTKEVIKPSFISGFTAIGIFYLTGKPGLFGEKQKSDFTDQLLLLKKLKESDYLTEDEFKKAKSRLLD